MAPARQPCRGPSFVTADISWLHGRHSLLHQHVASEMQPTEPEVREVHAGADAMAIVVAQVPPGYVTTRSRALDHEMAHATPQQIENCDLERRASITGRHRVREHRL